MEDRDSRAAAELALEEGDLLGAMPSWRRMAMDMRGPSASSVSALPLRCMRSGLCRTCQHQYTFTPESGMWQLLSYLLATID